MSREKYQPTPAPLGANALPEYVLRELRRVGNVINAGIESLEASLSAVAADVTQYSASHGLRMTSISALLKVVELDGSALTKRSASHTELYYMAWDESLSAAVRVPGASVGELAAGGGGGGGYKDGLKNWDYPYETTASIVTWSGGVWDDFARGDSTLSVDKSGTRFTGAVPWTRQEAYVGNFYLKDGYACFEGSGSYNSYFRLMMDPGTLSTSWSLMVKVSFLSPMNNFSRFSIEIFDAAYDPSLSYTDLAASTYASFELKYSTGRKIEIAQYTPFVSKAVSGALDTVNYQYHPMTIRIKSTGPVVKYQAFYSPNPGGLIYESTLSWTTFGITTPRGIRLAGYGGASNADTRFYLHWFHFRT